MIRALLSQGTARAEVDMLCQPEAIFGSQSNTVLFLHAEG